MSEDVPGGPCPCSQNTLTVLARHHGLSALQWCRSNLELSQDVWGEQVVETAASMGDQTMLEWLRAQDPPIPWDDSVCAAAAGRGDINMLGWLRGQDPPCPWSGIVTEAAAGRDTAALQWLRAQQPPCPWDERSCAAAARAGKLGVLIWLRAQDPPCPWSGTSFEAAAHQPDVEILKWLHGTGCPEALPTSGICIPAAQRGHLAVLQWLCDQGHPLTKELYQWTALTDQSHILRFLLRMKVAPPEYNGKFGHFGGFSLPMAMFLADIGTLLPEVTQNRVTQARKAHCAFHGLVRWWRKDLSGKLIWHLTAWRRTGQGRCYSPGSACFPLISFARLQFAARLQHDVFQAT